jgi:hypothetical protein
MLDALMIGFAGLAVLIGLIALRMPIAYAMILVGGIGVTILNGPAIFLNQLKTLAYGQFSIYDLTVVPMFVLMGALATKAGLSRDLFRAPAPGSAGCAAAPPWRRSPPARASARSAGRRWPPPRPWAASPCRSCAATAIPARSRPARWPRAGCSAS